jgi:drug/metabolite transporter (DMT)-like permease
MILMMGKGPKTTGVVLVLLGAISYGILATIVKYANHTGVHTSVLTFMQFLLGAVFLIIYSGVCGNRNKLKRKTSQYSKLRLLLFGTSLGLTSSLYYLSIQFIPVSMGIILLMQSIWMSIVLETVLQKGKIQGIKIIGALLVIGGTILATNVLFQVTVLNWKGLALGLGAGLCYTISLYSSSNVETHLPSYVRSMYLVFGGLIAILLFWNTAIIDHFNDTSVLIWGLVLALFGTILPPLLFTKGIPLTGIGLGSIIAAIEIPISIVSASIILKESVSNYQWLGVIIIILSVIVVNKNTFSEQ